MSAAALEQALTKYPNAKAVIVVNLYGQSADYVEQKTSSSP
jgi:dTDP-4-amino-4,6-dideoxygalactose transaminase